MLRSLIIVFVGAVLVLPLLPAIAGAEPRHAIAMHGDPKYPKGFSHLDYVNKDAPKRGEIRRGVQGTFDSLNHYIIKGVPAAGRSHVHESLLKRVWDEPFTLYAHIADTVDTPEDRSWVEFSIRREARFHDGSPITVDDVLFSYETFREKGRANMRLFYRKVASAERVGDRSVRFTFDPEQADREMPLIMGLMPIISKAYYTTHPFEETTLAPPLGSGPYRVATVDPGRSIVYERVPDYWGKDLPTSQGQDNFERIRYEYFRDANVLMEAFKVGDVDFRVENQATKWETAYDFAAATDGRVTREEMPHGRPSGMRAFVFNTRREIFADSKVREALGYAFDFEWVNANLLHNGFVRTTSFFDNSELAAKGEPSPEELELLEPWRGKVSDAVFDVVAQPPRTDGTGNNRENLRIARAMLEQAGWEVRGGKMVRVSDQKPLEFQILLVFPENERIALAFSRGLERLGIKASVRTVDTAQYEFRRREYDFDMIINFWGISLSPGNEQSFYWGSAAAEQAGTRNYIGVQSPAIDSLIEKLNASRSRGELVTAMRAIDRVLIAEHYVVPLYHRKVDLVAYWSKLAHPDDIPTYGFVTETWWIRE